MRTSRKGRQALALGIFLASRGALVRVALALTAAVSLVFAFIALGNRRLGGEVPMLATLCITWGAGVPLAVGSALGAIDRDRSDGIIALARARGVGEVTYIRARVGGLVALLVLAIGSATLIDGAAATLRAANPLHALRESLAAVAYALAFSATLGPLALAALGTGPRATGYAILMGALVLPEFGANWSATLLPEGWHELTSITAALGAVHHSLAVRGASCLPMLRALAGLIAIIALSLGVIRMRWIGQPGSGGS